MTREIKRPLKLRSFMGDTNQAILNIDDRVVKYHELSFNEGNYMWVQYLFIYHKYNMMQDISNTIWYNNIDQILVKQ